MHSVIRRRRPGFASATGLLIALTILGVLLMHSVTPTTSARSEHAAMASATHHEDPVQVAVGEHDCPSGHQMMHPCAGTTVSWAALSVPATSVDVAHPVMSEDGIGGRVHSISERAPPWTLWELDRSVTLRV
ncbi:MAG: DUF6153 family protein [Rhodococcus sp.]|jgi:hypothetical protein|nr:MULTISPECIES: DUF6153 family protein [Rhodococcus]MSX05118.1 hypothetical protein [Actinomycetota bacterium]KMJ50448.1 hypothetical protein ACG96_06470 [Rhodococcus fascians]MBW4780838.1 hypothetical protein [Rhodococcus fascians]MCX6489454.1 DUF6153 family protein [Rhodococcus sp. (in: high G+C Gram-positive bacteria)]OZC38522.1 hypothetical protein CHX23_21010 [Rhodococcus fascians]